MAIRTLLVDDHPVFLEGLAVALGAQPDIQVVGTALTGEEGLALVRDRTPDLVVVDYLLPDTTGPDLVRLVHAEQAETLAVVLTASDESEYVDRALEAGASAFLRKELSIEALHASLALVMRGYEIWPAGWSRGTASAAGDLEAFGARHGLTPGELEILLLLASGRSNASISRVRGVSPQTIKNQTTALYRKLGVSSRVEATLVAARAHVLPD